METSHWPGVYNRCNFPESNSEQNAFQVGGSSLQNADDFAWRGKILPNISLSWSWSSTWTQFGNQGGVWPDFLFPSQKKNGIAYILVH